MQKQFLRMLVTGLLLVSFVTPMYAAPAAAPQAATSTVEQPQPPSWTAEAAGQLRSTAAEKAGVQRN